MTPSSLYGSVAKEQHGNQHTPDSEVSTVNNNNTSDVTATTTQPAHLLSDAIPPVEASGLISRVSLAAHAIRRHLHLHDLDHALSPLSAQHLASLRVFLLHLLVLEKLSANTRALIVPVIDFSIPSLCRLNDVLKSVVGQTSTR